MNFNCGGHYMEFVEPLRTQEELDAMNYYFKSI